MKRNKLLVGSIALFSSILSPPVAWSAQQIQLSLDGGEEIVASSDPSQCEDSVLLDSPARALRHPDGSLVVYATHYNNWYLAGGDWAHLKPTCKSAVRGHENPDPAAVDDRDWIQGLASDDGVHVTGLASQDYHGTRHNQCNAPSSKDLLLQCWFSSITQFESSDGALTFRPANPYRIVATPQVLFDPSKPNRVGFLTTSNIVTDGDWRYVLIYVDEDGKQKAGTCLFRASKTSQAPQWLAWDGKNFAAEMDHIPAKNADADHSSAACEPIAALGSINRGLVRDRASGTWIAVGPYHERSGRQGVYYSVSQDLLKWGPPQFLAEFLLDFQPPQCPPVYKYPSIIDHNAPGFMFDSVGDRAYLYLTKVPFDNCKIGARQLVRIPLKISRVERDQSKH